MAGDIIFQLRFKQLEILQAASQFLISQLQNVILRRLRILTRVHPLHRGQLGNIFDQPETLWMSRARQCRMIRSEAAPIQFQGFPIAGSKGVALNKGDAVKSDGGLELRGGGLSSVWGTSCSWLLRKSTICRPVWWRKPVGH